MMSDEKKSGIFVNKKSPGAAAPASPSKPKDVQRRWLYVGVGLIGVVIVSSSIFGGGNKKTVPVVSAKDAAAAGAMISVTPANADKAAFESGFAKELTAVKQKQEKMEADIAAKDKELKDLKESKPKLGESLPPSIVAPPVAGNTGGLDKVGSPPPAPPGPVVRGQIPANLLPPVASGKGSIAELPPAISLQQNSDPMVFDAPSKGKSDSGSDSSSSASTGTPAVSSGTTPNTRVRYQKNANAGLLPAGAFAPVALLNGLDAGTSAATQSNPMPVLLNITEQATLPGAAKYKLKSCFVLGTGYGDLSAERVYVRFARLSCVDKSDRLVLSQEVQGYLVDSDGKLGLRGVVMDRQGAKLGKAMLAGFAQGLSGALGSAQSNVMSNVSTGQTTSSITGASALRSSGLGGAQTAASQLAEFYLKEAQSIFPVISVDAGRTGTIVFSSSVSLNWSNGDTQYVQQVSPN